jgi:hypothetical protein
VWNARFREAIGQAIMSERKSSPMTIPDPNKDILDKLDRREARTKIVLPGFLALAWGVVAGLAAYEITKLIFKWIVPAPLYGALVILIAVTTWVFVRLTAGR